MLTARVTALIFLYWWMNVAIYALAIMMQISFHNNNVNAGQSTSVTWKKNIKRNSSWCRSSNEFQWIDLCHRVTAW